VEEGSERAAWWRSPRLVAAAACFLLGSAVLVVGLAPRFWPPSAEGPALVDDGLAGLDGLGPVYEEETPDAPEELIVYVSGAVAAPDVYRLPPGARVKDAVVAAGGLRADAAAEQINLAEAVGDAQHIHVPTLAGPAGLAPQGADAEVGTGGLIDLNSASAAELEELPGVGAVLAERIVARREEAGPYGSVDELREVTGVGPKLFEQIAPLVRAGP
jgi:competence protein ComEA